MARPGLRRPPAVARVLAKLTETVRRHEMFEPGTAVLVAVSGGPDSVCLLHALVRGRRLLRIEPAAFHFDHRLSEGSERHAAYVRSQAERLGVPFVLRRAGTAPARGESVEAWARTARYAAMADARAETGAERAAVGHTADDQAETVLLALLRGGGLDAVAAIRPVTGTVVRPLLEVRRRETVAFCRSLGLRPRHDPMNDDPAFMRVAVRTRVIPQLEAAVGRSVTEALARTAGLLQEDAGLLDALADQAEATVFADDGRTALAADVLLALPRPLASRVVVRAIRSLGGSPDAAHVDAVLALAAKPPGRRASLPGGLAARREREYVRLSPPGG